MIEIIAKFFKILNSETEPYQISLAFCFSMIAGFTPVLSPHNLLVLLIVLLMRVNLTAFILGWVVFSTLAFALDPFFHLLGLGILKSQALESLLTTLYNTIWFRLDHLNNSIVMGSLAMALVLFVPLFFLFNMLINKYREHILEWVRKTRFMKMLKASNLYNIYQSVSGWGGAA